MKMSVIDPSLFETCEMCKFSNNAMHPDKESEHRANKAQDSSGAWLQMKGIGVRNKSVPMDGVRLIEGTADGRFEGFKDLLIAEGWIDPCIPTDYDVHPQMGSSGSLFAVDEGGCVVSGILWSEDAEETFLATFMTKASERGKGIGSRLSEEFHRLMAERRPNIPITIGSTADMTAAYRSRGFPFAVGWTGLRLYVPLEPLLQGLHQRLSGLSVGSATSALPWQQLSSPRVADYDQGVAGTRREAFLRALGSVATVHVFVAKRGETLRGLLVGREISGCFKLGGLYADSRDEAFLLLRDALVAWRDLVRHGRVSLTIPTVGQEMCGGDMEGWIAFLRSLATNEVTFDLSASQPIDARKRWANVALGKVFAEFNHGNAHLV